MRTRLHIQRKAPSKSSSAPVTNPFKSRPFAPPTTNEEAPLQQQTTPDLQAQQERRQGFGYNFANVSVTPRDTVAPLMLQPKLTIGEPGDKYEQEADDMARQVVSQINAPQSQPSGQAGTIQRDEMPKPEDEEAASVQPKLESGTIQRDEMPKPEDEEAAPVQAKSMVQRQSDGGGKAAPPQLEESIQQSRGSGQPLADNIRKPMEQSFGADFSGVKVHTDSRADQLNQSIQARAFTTGQDIFFRQGNYNPGSQDGQELVAHELTHVVQQSGGAIQQKPSE
ncbi:MAG TPA: DUF4157 domain-containing protein [Coleofasciculaceae cyanobacterium]